MNVETGAWHCHRCERSGLLEEHKAPPNDDPLRREQRRHEPRQPSPDELADREAKRARLRRLWATTIPIAEPMAARGADYLWSREIPLAFAVEARVRYSPEWYSRPAVVFPLQDATGRGVAAETRLIDGREPKSLAAGPKSAGVFAAPASAIRADVLAVVEGPITALSLAACGLPALALCGHVLRPWLATHLAGRLVFVALDWDETDRQRDGDEACRALHAVGARPHRLSPPAGAGDWNDYLRAVGLASMRAELEQAVGAVDSGPACACEG